MLDVAYVGTFGENIGATTQLNALPYGKRFEAASLDPSRPVPQALPDNFLRPYQGYARHPLGDLRRLVQLPRARTSLQRRFADGFQMGVAIAGRKRTTSSDGGNGDVVTFNRRDVELWPGRLRSDALFAANYLFDLPGDGLRNGLLRGVLGGWQISGLTRFQSGAPALARVPQRSENRVLAPCAVRRYHDEQFRHGPPAAATDLAPSSMATRPCPRRPHHRCLVQHVGLLAARTRAGGDRHGGRQRVLARGTRGGPWPRSRHVNTDLALFKNIDLAGNLKVQLRIEA